MRPVVGAVAGSGVWNLDPVNDVGGVLVQGQQGVDHLLCKGLCQRKKGGRISVSGGQVRTCRTPNILCETEELDVYVARRLAAKVSSSGEEGEHGR